MQSHKLEFAKKLVIDYFANGITSENVVKKLGIPPKNDETASEVLALYDRNFRDAKCNEEGPTKEQDEELDYIIETAAEELLDLTK